MTTVSERGKSRKGESEAGRQRHPTYRRRGGRGAEGCRGGSQSPLILSRTKDHTHSRLREGGVLVQNEVAGRGTPGAAAAVAGHTRQQPRPQSPPPPPRPHPCAGAPRYSVAPRWSRSHRPPGGPFPRRPRPPAHTVSATATTLGEGGGHGGAAGLSPQLLLSVYTPAIPFVMYIIVNIICKYIEFKRMNQVHKKWA